MSRSKKDCMAKGGAVPARPMHSTGAMPPRKAFAAGGAAKVRKDVATPSGAPKKAPSRFKGNVI